MRKLLFISFSIMLVVACTDNKDKDKSVISTDNVESVNGLSSIAVINTDSILEKYIFAIEARETITKKAEDARLSFNTKTQQLQKEMVDFQNKIENNAFLSRQRAEQEAGRLQKKEADIRTLGEKLEADFIQEQQKLSNQLKDSINMAISEINKDKKYSIVISTSSLTDNVLYADEALNITQSVLEYLNTRLTNY